MRAIADHDAYIAAAPERFHPSLQRVRAILGRTLPDAEEVVAYDMPGFRIGGAVVASYAAFSKQCGLYLQAGALAEHAEDIAAAGLKATRTGITFSPSRPIPDELVERLALASREAAVVRLRDHSTRRRAVPAASRPDLARGMTGGDAGARAPHGTRSVRRCSVGRAKAAGAASRSTGSPRICPHGSERPGEEASSATAAARCRLS